jgi:heptosyltransferase-2
LLENNPYITEVIPYGTDALVRLSSSVFDRVINLDAGKISAGMATAASAKQKIGFVLHEDGFVRPSNRAAGIWLRMGIFDDLKKTNKHTYQEIMCSILGLPTEGLQYILKLTEKEKEDGRNYLLKLGLNLGKKIIGIHTGGSGRWLLKQWAEDSFVALILQLAHEPGDTAQAVLLGGPLERELNRRILDKVTVPVFAAGCENEVRHFAALTNCCSVVLCADSLAMHVALAMGRRVVVLFGPTSSSEIELFGLGEKVFPDLDCLACYRRTCDFNPNCMDAISVDMVKRAISRQLAFTP